MSMDELADEFKTTQQTVSRWELNQSRPNFDTLIKIAEFFDVSLDYLVRGK